MQMQIFGYIALGLIAGVLSGLVGSGGGIIIVPALVYFFGLTMHTAQGTTMALFLPPIGILAAWSYYQHGNVDIKAALLVAAGFTLGGFFGAKVALNLSEDVLRKTFAIMLAAVAVKMFMQKAG
ncbi:MAG TPA: sulfite exporter TauE/SafE family protein [Alphaproteobacteria bacterium]|nr:sulfite exporter TauE/SafE family protein [Alphaproteobacteria bacterium]